ncbi:MAG: hypothetical protein CVU97_02780 [Firmicutes bacterium HGW-Firmicutes-21]|nr:MAG: hypothetical protein CVU97_02780 [Firmicutes bacterium HGW-Firmicutes-21]
MKLLVLALYAQYRVGAGRMGLWAARNGMRRGTHFPLRPYSRGRMVTAAFAAHISYGLRIRPITRCILRMTLWIDVACLEWLWRIEDHTGGD